MDNPIEAGTYTTIFKDGSIIHHNQWLVFPDSPQLNKWYFNEEYRGGVIHWFKPDGDYKFHKSYTFSDWELRELVSNVILAEACYDYFDYNDYKKAVDNYCAENKMTFNEAVSQYIEKYYKQFEVYI